MATLNKVMLIGRVTADPEPPKTLSGGSQVIKFQFAVSRSRKDPQTGQWINDQQLFIDCEAFAQPEQKRNLVSLIKQYVHKGSQLYIEGRLQLDEWEKDGQKRSRIKLVMSDIQFLGEKSDGSHQPIAQQQSRTAAGSDHDTSPYNDSPDGTIPF